MIWLFFLSPHQQRQSTEGIKIAKFCYKPITNKQFVITPSGLKVVPISILILTPLIMF